MGCLFLSLVHARVYTKLGEGNSSVATWNFFQHWCKESESCVHYAPHVLWQTRPTRVSCFCNPFSFSFLFATFFLLLLSWWDSITVALLLINYAENYNKPVSIEMLYSSLLQICITHLKNTSCIYTPEEQ